MTKKAFVIVVSKTIFMNKKMTSAERKNYQANGSQFEILPAHGLILAESNLLVAQLCGCRMTTVVPRVGNSGWKGFVFDPSYWRPFSSHGVLTLFFGYGNSPLA